MHHCCWICNLVAMFSSAANRVSKLSTLPTLTAFCGIMDTGNKSKHAVYAVHCVLNAPSPRTRLWYPKIVARNSLESRPVRQEKNQCNLNNFALPAIKTCLSRQRVRWSKRSAARPPRSPPSRSITLTASLDHGCSPEPSCMWWTRCWPTWSNPGCSE